MWAFWVNRLKWLQVCFTIGNTAWSSGVDLDQERIGIKNCFLGFVLVSTRWVRRTVCIQLWCNFVSCCLCCYPCRSRLASINVISSAILRLHLLLVSFLLSSFTVRGFVSFDMWFDPHTKHHCSLLETLTNPELGIDFQDPFVDEYHCNGHENCVTEITQPCVQPHVRRSVASFVSFTYYLSYLRRWIAKKIRLWRCLLHRSFPSHSW
jgi:hypothetical protein